jgi:cupin superfamily acireductone dioxygenase involved in methionine salvage
MMEYKTFEEELDAIRLAIYEEIKDMTTEERVDYFNSQAEPIIKEYGMKTMDLRRMNTEEHAKREVVLS